MSTRTCTRRHRRSPPPTGGQGRSGACGWDAWGSTHASPPEPRDMCRSRRWDAVSCVRVHLQCLLALILGYTAILLSSSLSE
uniref:Uncharacterized protein n=1 Tax=Triticum urartu TaxID=4572 RepID=A0A8R7QH31_TRIUA